MGLLNSTQARRVARYPLLSPIESQYITLVRGEAKNLTRMGPDIQQNRERTTAGNFLSGEIPTRRRGLLVSW